MLENKGWPFCLFASEYFKYSNADCGLHTKRPQLSNQTDVGFTPSLSSYRLILTSIPKITSLRISLSPPSAALMMLRG